MNGPTMFESQKVAPDTTSLNSYIPLPGLGQLPVNAFMIDAQEPVLIDTGMAAVRNDFLKELRSTTDLEALRWIWITHADADHLGNLDVILKEAPNARVVTTYMGMGKMGLQGLPSERMYLLNPGQSLDVGDRKLTAITPPTFDAPETTGLFDEKTRTLFSADCFGAILDSPAENAKDISHETLREGSMTWTSIDAPWLGKISPDIFANTLSQIENLNADIILSSHLPVAKGMTKTLLGILTEAQHAPAFVGPDQAALEKMMAA